MKIYNDNDNTDYDTILQTIAAIAGNDNDVYHVIVKVYDMTNNTVVSVSVVEEATFSVVTMKLYNNTAFNTGFTSALHASPSCHNDSLSFTIHRKNMHRPRSKISLSVD